MILSNTVTCALCSKKTHPESVLERYRVICYQCARDLFNLNLANREQKLEVLYDKAVEAWSKDDLTQSALFFYQWSFYRERSGGFRTFGNVAEEPKEPLQQDYHGPIFGDSFSYLVMVPNLPKVMINLGPPRDFDSNPELESLWGRPWRMFDEKFLNEYEIELLLSDIFVKTLINPENLERFAVKNPWLLLVASNHLMTIDWAFFFDLSDWVKARFKSLDAILASDSLDCRISAGIALFHMIEQKPIEEWSQLGGFELVIEGGSRFESRLRYFHNVAEDAEYFGVDVFSLDTDESVSIDESMYEEVLYDLQRDYFLMTDQKNFRDAFEVHFKILMILKKAPASGFPNLKAFRDFFATP